MKVTLSLGAVLVIGVLALAGTGAYYFLRHLDTKSASEPSIRQEVDAVRARFSGRPPLVEIVNFSSGDVRINRLVHPQGLQATRLHLFSYEPATGKRLRSDVPVWLMRFSTLNIASRLGVAPSKFRLTVDDLKRYGPGVVVDFRPASGDQVLIWLE